MQLLTWAVYELVPTLKGSIYSDRLPTIRTGNPSSQRGLEERFSGPGGTLSGRLQSSEFRQHRRVGSHDGGWSPFWR